jgi:DNA-binding protein H-NS
MSERQGDSVVDWLEIDLARLSGIERVTLINEIMDLLTAQELGQVLDSAQKKRTNKLATARLAFFDRIKQEAKELDLSFEEAVEMASITQKARKPREKREIQAKYRSPAGETWSGRGRVPVWLRNLEAEGHNRQEYLVQAEE